MMSKFAIAVAALAAMCLAPLGTARAQKNKKNKNSQPAPLVQEAPAALSPLTPGQGSFFVTMRASKQGILKGQSTSAQHAGQIVGLQFLFQLTAPHDAGTGRASGRRQYAPVVFTKMWDASSPQLVEAAATGEVFPLVEFDFVRTASDGKESVYETIKLTDAMISGIKRYIGFPDAGESPDQRHLEDVSLTFQKIEVSNNEAKTIAMDDWTAAP